MKVTLDNSSVQTLFPGKSEQPNLSVPVDVAMTILSLMEENDLCKCASLSKTWKVATENNTLWKSLFEKTFVKPEKTSPDVNYKQLYRERLAEPHAKLVLFAKKLDSQNISKREVLLSFENLPKKYQNDIFELALWPEEKGGQFSDCEIAYFANPLDARFVGAVQGYAAKQKKIAPLVAFQKIVEDDSQGPEAVVSAFSALPKTQYEADGVKNTLGEMVKYRLWELNGKNDEGLGIDFGMHFIETRPHDDKLKQAIIDTISKF